MHWHVIAVRLYDRKELMSAPYWSYQSARDKKVQMNEYIQQYSRSGVPAQHTWSMRDCEDTECVLREMAR
jgi:predicted component of type VI protein secretion system